MYTDEDLNSAVKAGIFEQEAVSKFRSHVAEHRQTPAVDEENFRLIGGFNDIFVVIACSLLLISASWAGQSIGGFFASLIVPCLSWGLAEFFVRKRKMALPAIVLLLSFVGGTFVVFLQVFSGLEQNAVLVSAAVTTIGVYLHWLRFRVPITVAAGAATVAIFFVTSVAYFCYEDFSSGNSFSSSLLDQLDSSKDWLTAAIFFSGISIFTLAMYWDSADRKRISRQSDVAFWLHLLSAPLIVHPAFAYLGILKGVESIGGLMVIGALYIVLTAISLIIDRRAFMVSSLAYVLYAISSILEIYGVVGYSFAITGICISAGLLFLSAFWHTARKVVLSFTPEKIKNYVPELKD